MSRADVPRIGPKKPVRLYIHQWMEKLGKNQVDIYNRLADPAAPKSLSTGTISKKLAKPEKMSVEWLHKIAWALDLEVEDLHRDPNRPTQEDLLRDLDPNQKTVVIEMIKGLKRA